MFLAPNYQRTTSLKTKAEILHIFSRYPGCESLPECTPDILDRLRLVQIAGARHGKKGHGPIEVSAPAIIEGTLQEIRDLETALDIDDGAVFELYSDAHSAFFRDGTINPGERDTYCRNSCFTFHFGAYGDTTVSLWAQADHIDSALEMAADWLADHAPGMFIEPDYAGAAEELGLPFDAANFDYDSRDGQRILELAEQDLTNTERGWLISHEWTVSESDEAPGPTAK